MDSTSLMIGVITGAIGVGFFVYGKKQRKPIPLIAGLLLCVLPYAIDSQPVLIGVCAILVVAPFVIRS